MTGVVFGQQLREVSATLLVLVISRLSSTEHPTQGDTKVTHRKLIIMFTAAALPIGLVTIAGVSAASASSHAAINQPGAVHCNKISGTITFSPPLTLNGTSPENTNINITVKGCTVTGGTVKPKKGTVNQNISKAGSTNGCSSLQTSQAETLTVVWAPGNKINPTTASFSGYDVATNGAGDEGFKLPQSGGTGSSVGSYAQASGVTASAFSNKKQADLLAACTAPGGLATLKLTSGSIN